MRWFGWFRHKTPKPPQICQCGHEKCYHIMGSYGCWKDVSDDRLCRCAHYTEIPAKMKTNDELEQLRKMAGIR